MATNKTYKDYKTIMQVIEIEKGETYGGWSSK